MTNSQGPDPKTGLILAIILIIATYLFNVLWESKTTLVNPLDKPNKPNVRDEESHVNQVYFKCINGYLYYEINGKLHRASSTIQTYCGEELNGHKLNQTRKHY